MKYQEIKGNLIAEALAGKFDVIVHGCNCFCIMGKGLAPQMVKTFECDKFFKEGPGYKGDINKLGTIEFEVFLNDAKGHVEIANCDLNEFEAGDLVVVNAYTQYHPGANLDYEALTLCLKKMNHVFKGKHIGLPQIGCGIAGGVWENNINAMFPREELDVKTIIQQELKDCDVTIVMYKNS